MGSNSVKLLLVLVWVTECKGEDDLKEVLEVRTACLYHRALSFSCPEDHIVVLRRAHYLIGESDGCNTDDPNTCEAENIVEEWFWPCHSSNVCEIAVRAPNKTDNHCAGFQGDPFLEVVYKCEVYMGVFYETSVRDMCNFGKTFHGSLMYLWNANYPHFSSDADCGCRVKVDTDIELQINVQQFQLSDEQYDEVVASGCSQAIDIQGGYVRKTICSQHHNDISPVEIDRVGDVYIHYRNPENYYARLWIVVQVHYEHNFTLDCQRNFPMPPLPTLPDTTDVTTENSKPHERSQEPSEDQDNQALQQANLKHWPIITAVVAVLCVLLVAGITVLLFCRTRLRDKIMKQKGIVETDNFRFENSVYMNHSQVDRQSNRSSESGSQHQVYINVAGNHPASNVNHHSNSPLPPKQGESLPRVPEDSENPADVPDIIPAAVLQRLGFQSETSPPEVGEIRGSEKIGSGNASESGEGASRNNSLSVKDRAKLIESNGLNNAV